MPAARADKCRSVSLLGATGSIGASTIDLLLRHKDRYRVEAVTAHSRVDELARIARDLDARIAVIADERKLGALRDALSGTGIEVAAGHDAVTEAASRPVDWVMAAIVGSAGLASTFAAARSGADLALANKESLVCAGSLLLQAMQHGGGALLPADSEHNAIFQCLGGREAVGVEEIVLTASGGPFRAFSQEQMRHVSLEQALKHPTWTMGAKITIDSATLVNKGLELIEAQHLFAVSPGKLAVLVHPQSIIHGLVRMKDGSVLAHLGPPDMRVPIASCLAWPERIETGAAPLDLVSIAQLQFEAPDLQRFPGLRLAMDAMRAGGGAPCAFNAANEIAVAAFLARRIGFMDIPALIGRTMETCEGRGLLQAPDSLEDVIGLDLAARQIATQIQL